MQTFLPLSGINTITMLQRIQTLYLAAACLFTALFSILPLAVMFDGIISHPMRLIAWQEIWTSHLPGNLVFFRYGLLVLSFLGIALNVYAISHFRNRRIQIKTGKMNIMLHAAIMVLSFFMIDQIKSLLPFWSFSYGPAIFLLPVSLVLILMANRAIRSDENLIRAADRLR